MPDIRRGDIYYIRSDYPPTGSEQGANRPGVIVSNDMCNKYSPVASIVYLTTRKANKPLPTHVHIRCTHPSIALCEQVHSVSKERLEGYMGHITEQEKREIDEALKVSLAIKDEGVVQMSELAIINKDGILTIDSREVAEMVGKEHFSLMRDIRTYCGYLGKSKTVCSEFFIESEYRSEQNKTMPCYLITRKGCDMVANKMTGERGILFTATYVNRFHEMEQRLSTPQLPQNYLEALKALVASEEEKQALQTENQNMLPKAAFFDAVANSKDAIEMAAVAKVLAIPGYGRNNLFEFLRNHKVLQENNQPYQRHIDAGRFRLVEQKYNKPDGSTHISIKTLVYQKGVDYIRRLVTQAS